MSKDEMLNTIFETLKTHLNVKPVRDIYAERNSREKIEDVYRLYIQTGRTHDDGMRCARLLR